MPKRHAGFNQREKWPKKQFLVIFLEHFLEEKDLLMSKWTVPCFILLPPFLWLIMLASRGGDNIGLQGPKWRHVPKHVENLREKLEILAKFVALSDWATSPPCCLTMQEYSTTRQGEWGLGWYGEDALCPSWTQLMACFYHACTLLILAVFSRTKSACNQCAHWRWLLVIKWWQHKIANSQILYNCKSYCLICIHF